MSNDHGRASVVRTNVRNVLMGLCCTSLRSLTINIRVAGTPLYSHTQKLNCTTIYLTQAFIYLIRNN